MYLFVTYGEPGWRGVQVRNLDVAKYFNKKDILFVNGVDSKFIKKERIKCRTIDTSLIDPQEINFPPSTKALIFADLPTNELYNLSLFYRAREKNIPVVIFDNLMRRGQSKEGVFKKLIDNCDLFFFNGLDFMKTEETKKIKVIPPLPEYKNQPDAREKLLKKYNIDSQRKIIFASSYEDSTKTRIEKFYKSLSRKTKDFKLILLDTNSSHVVQKGNQIRVPYLKRQDFLEHVNGADFIISKFGYLQLLEILALKKPVIVAGKGGYVLETNVLDKKLQEVILYANDFEELTKFSYRLIKDNNFSRELIKKISKLHNGEFGGAKTSASIIQNTKFKRGKEALVKKVIVLLNDEIKKAEELIKKEEYLLVIGIIAPTSKPGPMSVVKRPDETALNRRISELLLKQEKEILPHTFKKIYLFSRRKYDGFLDIFPWYSYMIEELKNTLKTADKVFISPQANKLISNITKSFKKKTRIVNI